MSITTYLQLVLYMFFPLCIIDSLNGFLIYNGVDLQVSVIYKIIFLIVVLYGIISEITTWLVLVVIGVIYFKSSQSSIFLLYDLSQLIKGAFFIFLFILFYKYKDFLTLKDMRIVENIFLISFMVVGLSVISGLFGFGLTTYGGQSVSVTENFGFKGYFYAGNEVGALLISIYPVVWCVIREKFGFSSRLIFSLIFVLICFLVGTKTAIFACLILFFISYKDYLYRNIIASIVAVFGFAVILFFLYFILESRVSEKMDSVVYLYDRDGFLTTVLSGRDVFLNDALAYVTEKFNFMDYLLGIGFSYADSSFKSVEIDFFDILFTFGLLGAFGIYVSYALYFFRVYCYMTYKADNIFIYTLLLLLLISNLAGHVILSVMVCPFISLYLPYLYVKNKDFHEDFVSI